MTTRIDHFMYAVASLDDGIEWAADTFGVAPAYGGAHVGGGTRNALLSLDSAYLEIIAPDPAQTIPSGSLAERITSLSEGGLVTWAAEGDLPAIAQALARHGVETLGPNRTQRQTAEGDLLIWDLLFPRGSPHGARMPFFIDWLECRNPRETNPAGGAFRSLTITTTNAGDLDAALTAIGLELDVSEGDAALSVSIESSRGEVVLASTPETAAISMR